MSFMMVMRIKTLAHDYIISVTLESGLDLDHGTPCLDSSNAPACYQSKSYNVHAMGLLDTKSVP